MNMWKQHILKALSVNALNFIDILFLFPVKLENREFQLILNDFPLLLFKFASESKFLPSLCDATLSNIKLNHEKKPDKQDVECFWQACEFPCLAHYVSFSDVSGKTQECLLTDILDDGCKILSASAVVVASKTRR